MDMVKGIDVSHFQKGINWQAAVLDGVKFAIIKFADGEAGTDALSNLFRQQAKAAGLIVGSYCFGRFWADPVKQADHFLSVTGGVLPGELPLSLDYEWDNSELTKTRFKKKYSDAGEADAFTDSHALKGLARLEAATNVVPMLYTAPSFFTSKNSAFSRYPLWLNDFKAKEVGQIRTPKVWARPTFWQCHEGPGYGVAGVDFNYFLGSLSELKALTKA